MNRKFFLIIIMAVITAFRSAGEPIVPTDTVFRDEKGNIRVTELEEVVVKPAKYSKKGNPAVDLMQKIRRTADGNDPRALPFYSFNEYEKISLGVNNFKLPKGEDKMGIVDFVESVPELNSLVLRLSEKEKVSKRLHRKSPGAEKNVVLAIRSQGIDESLNQENLKKVLEDVLRQVDVYGNDITIMQNRFVSPLSRIAADYYKFFLGDTVSIDGNRYLQLFFTPHNRESMGFNGDMLVEIDDSCAFIKHLNLRVPKGINLNYVNSLSISQDFVKDAQRKRHVASDIMTIVLQIMPGTPEIFSRRETYRNGFSYEHQQEYADYYDRDGYEHFAPDAYSIPAEQWDLMLGAKSPRKKTDLSQLLTRLRAKKWFYWGEKAVSLLEHGYIRTGKPSKFDIGPLNTFISANDVEGARFRLGGMTTAFLNKRLFTRFYGAYGTKDRRFKYGGELEYSFVDKKYHSYEFPVHSLRARYSYDIDQIGQHYLFTNQDNIFLSLKRMSNDKVTYRKFAQLQYTLERRNGFSLEAGLSWERQEPTRRLTFTDGLQHARNHYNQSSFFVKLRYAPGETFYQAASMRLPINLDTPIIQVTHEYGPAGLFGANFTFNKTEISFQKRFWLSAFGYIDGIIRGAKIWSKVYYPALTWANANLSYTIQPESFALMEPMEFATDQYLSWDLTYWMNGLIFNRIPFIKKAKLREVVAFRGYYGSLTDKNNPLKNPSLMQFPADADIGLMGHKPYMEASVGIDNIFTFLRVDWVWRLTYLDVPRKDKYGLRIALHFTF